MTSLMPQSDSTFRNDEYVMFWGSASPFSNWYKKDFKMVVDDKEMTFNCSEQAMMFFKALAMNDMPTAFKVMKEKDPRKQKKLGREIQHYDDTIWSTCREGIVIDILKAKFVDPVLKKYLLETGNSKIVEASPYDDIWGIKMGVGDANILNESKWQGLNLLGKCLMKVRDFYNKE